MRAALELTRAQILGFRRRAGGLEQRSPYRPQALRAAAWAGLTDSMPRAALLSLHARVEQITPGAWGEPPLVQVWGPRFSVYVVAAEDRPVFTVSRMPTDARGIERAESIAALLRDHLAGERRRVEDVGHALTHPGPGGLRHPNALRYASATGTVCIRWEGAGRPLIWTVARPSVTPEQARAELLRRYLHVCGPADERGFGDWAGLRVPAVRATFAALDDELLTVSSAIGDGVILAADESELRRGGDPPVAGAAARLLPSGDAYFLCWGRGRELLVGDARRRSELWTPRVWPGAVLVDGEIRGTWRRAGATLTVSAWGRLSAAARAAIEDEAADLPLPGLDRPVDVVWQ